MHFEFLPFLLGLKKEATEGNKRGESRRMGAKWSGEEMNGGEIGNTRVRNCENGKNLGR